MTHQQRPVLRYLSSPHPKLHLSELTSNHGAKGRGIFISLPLMPTAEEQPQSSKRQQKPKVEVGQHPRDTSLAELSRNSSEDVARGVSQTAAVAVLANLCPGFSWLRPRAVISQVRIEKSQGLAISGRAVKNVGSKDCYGSR